MDQIKPIKRSKELISLSRDHHDGLLLSWKIREGIKNGIELRIVNYTVHFYGAELAHHFDVEEQFLFPLLDKDNELRLKAEQEHATMRGLLNKLKEDDLNTESALQDFGKLLEAHIRFEERELFPFIEKSADHNSLTGASDKINEHSKKNKEEWEDTFWVKNR